MTACADPSRGCKAGVWRKKPRMKPCLRCIMRASSRPENRHDRACARNNAYRYTKTRDRKAPRGVCDCQTTQTRGNARSGHPQSTEHMKRRARCVCRTRARVRRVRRSQAIASRWCVAPWPWHSGILRRTDSPAPSSRVRDMRGVVACCAAAALPSPAARRGMHS